MSTLVKRFLTVMLTLLTICTTMAYSYPTVAAQAVDSSVIRIHVLAHDDTPREQLVKLGVRDKILEFIGDLVAGAKDSAEAASIVEANLTQLKRVAEDELNLLGLNHRVSLQWGKFVFPTRVYGSTALPAGSYQALNIVIGDGKGKNWWCIMYPPLCYVEGVVHKGHEVTYQFAVVNMFRKLWQKIIS